MKFDWKSRIKNKAFWITLIPAILLLIQLSVKVFGFEINFGSLSDQLVDVVNQVFIVLSILGIVINPQTDGFGDK